MNRRQFTLRTLFLLMTAVGISAGLLAPDWNAARQAARMANAYRLIDSEIAGTEVYFRDKLLGTTPLILTRGDCLALGLPASRGTVTDLDGWGEGLAFHDPSTNTYPRVMYKVPPSRAAAYLNYDTPWGSRTKMGGGWPLPNGFRSKFMSRGQDGLGVIVQIDFADERDPQDKVVEVVVTATNAGTGVYSGFRPEVQLLWGTFDVQWAHRSHETFPLPAQWASIAPGQSLQTTLEIPLPTATGDYSVFATLNVFRDETKQALVGHGSVYSDSKLLHVP